MLVYYTRTAPLSSIRNPCVLFIRFFLPKRELNMLHKHWHAFFCCLYCIPSRLSCRICVMAKTWAIPLCILHAAATTQRTNTTKKKRRTSSKNCGRIFSMHLNIKRFSPSAFIAGYRSSSILMRHAWAGNTQYTKRLCVVIRAVERAKKSMRKRFSFHKSIPFFCAHSFIHPRGTSHHCHSRQRLRTQFEPLLFGVALNIWMSPKRRVWCGSEFPSPPHCPHPDSDNLSFPSVLVVRRGGVAIYIHI